MLLTTHLLMVALIALKDICAHSRAWVQRLNAQQATILQQDHKSASFAHLAVSVMKPHVVPQITKPMPTAQSDGKLLFQTSN